MFSKRGVSPVIATVLLLVLTLVIVSILAVFVIPFVTKSLEGSDECFRVLGGISFDQSNYNCHYEWTQPAAKKRTGFSVRIGNDDVLSFKVTLYSGGSANPYDIQNNTGSDFIRMLDTNFSNWLDVPSKGGVRTYVANESFDRIEINPILRSGKTCDEHQEIKIERCIDQSAINALEHN